jgi:concentrative nucleoside transporter, CNT family
MQQFQGLIGIILILGIAWLVSNNKKQINYRLVLSGVLLQLIIALLIFKVPFVKAFFQKIGSIITHIEAFAKEGAAFVYGGLMVDNMA